jgi:gas vesicle structural protein
MSVVPSVDSAHNGASGGTLSDVVGLILDKGVVIDVYVRVSLVGIEILTVDARVVVASVDTYLRFAEAAGRLNLETSRKPGLPEVIHGTLAARSKAPAQLDPAAAPSPMPLEPAGTRRRTPLEPAGTRRRTPERKSRR